METFSSVNNDTNDEGDAYQAIRNNPLSAIVPRLPAPCRISLSTYAASKPTAINSSSSMITFISAMQTLSRVIVSLAPL